MNLKLFIILTLTLLTVLFIVQNVSVVEIRFLFWAVHMSRSVLIFLLLLIGFLIGWFLNGYLRYRKAKS